MGIIVCGQHDVLGSMCPECGGHLHAIRRGGFSDGEHLAVCSEECIESFQQHLARSAREAHFNVRDLMCACEVCTAAGHPTDAERREWADYHEGA